MQKVYKRGGNREHPREIEEACYDVCYETSLYCPMFKFLIQAEMIAIAYNSIKTVFIEQEGVIEVHVNDSRILDALMDYAEIKASIR